MSAALRAVNLAAMADGKDVDDAPSIIHLVDNPVVTLAHAIHRGITHVDASGRARIARQRLRAFEDTVEVVTWNEFQIAPDLGLEDDLVAVRHRKRLEKAVFLQLLHKLVVGDAFLLAAEPATGDGEIVGVFQGLQESLVHQAGEGALAAARAALEGAVEARVEFNGCTRRGPHDNTSVAARTMIV